MGGEDKGRYPFRVRWRYERGEGEDVTEIGGGGNGGVDKKGSTRGTAIWKNQNRRKLRNLGKKGTKKVPLGLRTEKKKVKKKTPGQGKACPGESPHVESPRRGFK